MTARPVLFTILVLAGQFTLFSLKEPDLIFVMLMMHCIKQNGYALDVNAVFARKYSMVCFILNIFLRIASLFHAIVFFAT